MNEGVIYYKVYDENDLIIEGYPSKICGTLNVTRNNLFKAGKYGGKIFSTSANMYVRVERYKNGEFIPAVKRVYKPNIKKPANEIKHLQEQERIKNEKEDEYKEIKAHLKIYGNTIVVKDPKDIVKRLEEEGIYVTVKCYKGTKTDWVLTIKEQEG